MANRYIRDTVILAKTETTYGTDAIPTGAANAMQVSNVNITPLNAQWVPRDLIRNYFGASEEMISSYNTLVSFDIEAVGSGTLGTAPAWGPVLRAAGWAETIVATQNVSYKPITNGQEAASIYVYDSGVHHKILGAKGAVAFNLGMGNIPKMSFAFVGLYNDPTAGTPTGVSIAAFQPPQVVQDQFTGDLTLGGTLAIAAAPSITSGTTYPSAGLEVDMGIKAEYIPLLGQQQVDIVDRQARGKIRLDLTAAQEVAMYATILAGTTQTVGLFHGTVSGRRFGLFGAKGQLVNPRKTDISGKRMLDYDVIFPPNTGNDEITVVTSF